MIDGHPDLVIGRGYIVDLVVYDSADIAHRSERDKGIKPIVIYHNTTVGADPHVTFRILFYTMYEIRCHSEIVLVIDREAVSVKAVKPLECTDPEKSARVLTYPAYAIV